MRRLLTILTLLSCLSFQWAQAKSVYGVVTSSAGAPLDVVSVELKEYGEGTYTDPRGRFSITLPSDSVKSYRVLFSLVGYSDVERTFLSDRDSIYLRVNLKENSIELGDVDVVAQKKQETSVEVLNVEVSKTIPTMTGDGIVSVVTTMPGVASNNELSSQYSVRGGNYDENCVYVNSIEVYRPFLIRTGEQEGLSFVNSDMVESVAFSSGGFTPEYGDKMSSVLDIKYKTPSAFEGSVSLSLLGATAYIGSSSPKFSQLHGFRFKSSSYVLNSLQTDAEYKPRFLDYQTYLTYRFSPKSALSFLGNISRNDYRSVPLSKKTNFGTMAQAKQIDFSFSGQEKDLFTTFMGSLSLNVKPTNRYSFDIIGSSFFTSEDVTYDITSAYRIGDLDMTTGAMVGKEEGAGVFHQHARDNLDANVTNLSFNNTLHLRKNETKWGASVQFEQLRQGLNEWEYRDSAGFSAPSRPEVMQLYENLNGEMDENMVRFSFFAQNTYTHHFTNCKMVAVGGLRMSYWSFNQQLTVSPRASLAWFPKNTNWGFRFATGIYHQSLFFKEMMAYDHQDNGNVEVSLNRDVKSPRSVHVIAASDYYFRKWGRPFKLTTELYYKYIDRIIPYRMDNMKVIYMGNNCADGFAFGGDVKIFGEFVPGVDSWISLSLMNAKENVYGSGAGYCPRPTDQRFNLSMFFQDYMPGFDKLKFSIKFIWSDGLPYSYMDEYVNRYGLRMKSYKRVDIGLSYHLRKGVDPVMERKFFSWMKTFAVNFDVFNLIGTRNWSSVYWVPTVTVPYSVPNYLTGRLLNLKLTIDF